MDNNNTYGQNQNNYGQNQGGQQYSSYYDASSQPQVQVPIGQEQEEPVSVGEWLISMLLMCIPCVNIVLMFVWAFGSSTKKSKSNYFKASLICAGIGIVLTIIMMILMSAGMMAAM